jgi:hypothetical protein
MGMSVLTLAVLIPSSADCSVEKTLLRGSPGSLKKLTTQFLAIALLLWFLERELRQRVDRQHSFR